MYRRRFLQNSLLGSLSLAAAPVVRFWRDPEHLMFWTKLVGNKWVLNDTYPNQERIQTLYLYHIPTDRRVVLGRFLSPPHYKAEWRCDLHPRCDQAGLRS